MSDVSQPKPNLILTVSERGCLFAFLFVVLPVFDAMNGYLVANNVIPEAGLASPSQLGRLMASAMLVWIIIRYRLEAVILLAGFYPILVEVLAGLVHVNVYGFSFGLVMTYKLLYLICMAVVFGHYLDKPGALRHLMRYVQANLYIISTLIFFSALTGIGNSSYGSGFGTKSFFASGNGLGLYLGVTSLLLLALNHYRFIRISTFSVVYFSVAMALIGTKTSLIFAAANLFLLVMLSRYRWPFLLCIGLGLMALLPRLIEAFNVVFDVIIFRYQRSESLLLYLGSGRIGYVQDAFATLWGHSDNIWRLLFGMGAFVSFQNAKTASKFDTLETDLFDIFFSLGLVGVIFYLGLLLIIAFRLRNHLILLFGFVLLALHSIIAGHVLFNGMSSVSLVLFLSVGYFLARGRNAQTVDREVRSFDQRTPVKAG